MMAVTWAGAVICLLGGILIGAWLTADVLLGPLKESVDRLQATQTKLVAALRAREPHPDTGELVKVVESTPVGDGITDDTAAIRDAGELRADQPLSDEQRDAFMAAIRREGKPGTQKRGGREFSPPPPVARGGSYYVPSGNLTPEEAPLFDPLEGHP